MKKIITCLLLCLGFTFFYESAEAQETTKQLTTIAENLQFTIINEDNDCLVDNLEEYVLDANNLDKGFKLSIEYRIAENLKPTATANYDIVYDFPVEVVSLSTTDTTGYMYDEQRNKIGEFTISNKQLVFSYYPEYLQQNNNFLGGKIEMMVKLTESELAKTGKTTLSFATDGNVIEIAKPVLLKNGKWLNSQTTQTDADEKVIQWTIDINPYLMKDMSNQVIVDNLFTNYDLDKSTIQQYELVEGNYVLSDFATIDYAPNELFHLTMKQDAGNKAYRLVYQTTINKEEYRYLNSVNLVNENTIYADVYKNINQNKVSNLVFKTLIYVIDPQNAIKIADNNNLIAFEQPGIYQSLWNIDIDPQIITSNTLTIDDYMDYRQSFYRGKYDVSSLRIIVDQRELASNQYTITGSDEYSDTPRLTITFNDTSIFQNTSSIKIEYKTLTDFTDVTLGNQMQEYEVINNAIVEGSQVTDSWSLNVPALMDNSILDKSSSSLANDVMINYEIKVNQNSQKLNDQASTLTLIDTLPANVYLKTDSIAVYDGISNTLITSIKGSYDSSKNQLSFILPDEKYLIVRYQLQPLKDNDQLYNSVNLIGDINHSEFDLVNAIVNDASVSGFGEPGSITIVKTTENFVPIERAEYGLYSQSDDRLLASVFTDAQGVAVFNKDAQGAALIDSSKIYYIQEISAPEYYQVDSTKYYFALSEQTIKSIAGQSIKIFAKAGKLNLTDKMAVIDLTSHKTWNDNQDILGKRPTSITIQLYKNGQPYLSPVEITEADNWQYTFKNLEKYTDFSLNTYTIQEKAIDGYQVSYASNSLDLTNTLIVEETREKINDEPQKENTNKQEITQKDIYTSDSSLMPYYYAILAGLCFVALIIIGLKLKQK